MRRSVLNRHPRILAALEECGLPWDIELGSNHYHIRVAGRMVGILPRGVARDVSRPVKNVIAQIRRQARELKEASHGQGAR